VRYAEGVISGERKRKVWFIRSLAIGDGFHSEVSMDFMVDMAGGRKEDSD